MTHEDLLFLLDRSISVKRPFIALTGSLVAAVMLSQAFYWAGKTEDADGWFFKTRQEWTDETGLTRTQQETARRILGEFGVLEESLCGCPAQLYFRVNVELLFTRLESASLIARKAKKRVDSPPGRKAARELAGNLPTLSIGTNITSYTTSKKNPYIPLTDEQWKQFRKAFPPRQGSNNWSKARIALDKKIQKGTVTFERALAKVKEYAAVRAKEANDADRLKYTSMATTWIHGDEWESDYGNGDTSDLDGPPSGETDRERYDRLTRSMDEDY